MSSPKPIGGYFELELQAGRDFLHANSILLNTARNCFEYILRSNKPTRVYMPRYTCDVMFEPLIKLGIPYELYSINDKLEIVREIELKPDELLVYTNYFGLKDTYTRELRSIYGSQLIVDASQALFYQPDKNGHTFYSPRKYLGIPDGGCLYTDRLLEDEFEQDVSYQRFSHLLKRIDLGAEAAYQNFKDHDKSFENQPIKKMSLLTQKLMASIDFDEIRERRRNNFAYLQKQLGQAGELAKAELDEIACPMYFIYRSTDPNLRQKLIANKIFVPTYWANVFEYCQEGGVEYKLASQLLPLPIDQRYNEDDMQRIVEVIRGS